MRRILEKAGLSFLRAFGSTLVVFALGIYQAPNFDEAKLIAVAAVVASIAAGFRAVQEFVPQLTVGAWVDPPLGGYIDSFVRAVLASFVAAMASINAVPDLGTYRNLVVAALVGAGAAGIKAIQGMFTSGETPAPGRGF